MKYDEILAAVGEGSAHPGGFSETVAFLKALQIPRTSTILEIGCGTGKTACLLAQMGYEIIAIDQNEVMIQKAKLRALQLNVTVEFEVAAMQHLPLFEKQFDVIIIESVTIFTDPKLTLAECFRVLKPGGYLYDREVFRTRSDTDLDIEFKLLYGAMVLPDYSEWLTLYEQAGFRDINLWQHSGGNTVLPEAINESMEIDPLQIIDMNIMLDPNLSTFFMKNSNFLNKHNDSLSYGVFVCRK